MRKRSSLVRRRSSLLSEEGLLTSSEEALLTSEERLLIFNSKAFATTQILRRLQTLFLEVFLFFTAIKTCFLTLAKTMFFNDLKNHVFETVGTGEKKF